MIGYITVGTNDIARAASFYDALFELLGATRAMQQDDFIAWTTQPNTPMFSIHIPANSKEATVGNGDMIALAAKDKAQVDAMHEYALKLGAMDEGKPGLRGDSGFMRLIFVIWMVIN